MASQIYQEWFPWRLCVRGVLGVSSLVVPLQRCRSVLVHGRHQRVTHASKMSHGNCVSHTPVNGIDLLAQLYDGSRNGFSTQPVKEDTSSQPNFAKQPSANR